MLLGLHGLFSGCYINMKLLNGFRQTALLPQNMVATIGNFDGVHRGHQALLASLRSHAVRLQCPALVILFEPQPSEFFRRHQAPVRLMGLREKLHALSHLGVDYVCCLKFNETLSQMTASEFADHILFKSLHVKHLLVGSDFRFGRDRAGDVDLLRTFGRKHGAEVETFPDFLIGNERISSTSIRQALQKGDLEGAASSLGRPYGLCGRVIKGDGRGRQWGIPTVNIALRRAVLPLTGVFSVTVRRMDKSLYQGVANIGRRPTVGGSSQLSVEVHLFDFDEQIYGEMLDIQFIHKLRDEMKFDSVDALIHQIHQDIYSARSIY